MTHPSGDFHWTRRKPELIRHWAKLRPEEVSELCAFYARGSSPNWLARRYGIGRTTVWRYADARGLVRKRLKQNGLS